MKEILLDRNLYKTITKMPFPDPCIICMKPTGGRISMLDGSISVPYCQDHIEKARSAHDFFENYIENKTAKQIADLISYGVAVLVFFLVASLLHVQTIKGWNLTLCLIGGAVAKFVVSWTLDSVNMPLRLKPIARKRGITIEEGSKWFIGVTISTLPGQEGKQWSFKFDNDEYADLFQKEMRNLISKDSI
jgi:hypothetical protein